MVQLDKLITRDTAAVVDLKDIRKASHRGQREESRTVMKANKTLTTRRMKSLILWQMDQRGSL